jgi:hypothetical protein
MYSQEDCSPYATINSWLNIRNPLY